MATTIDWANKIISVPRADMTLLQSVPVEVRELNLNSFRLELKDLEDDIEGMAFLDTHSHNTEVLLGGIVYARVLEIINGYTITFEDGQYAVNLIGANSNVGDNVNVNQVSVRSANSAGLISNSAIEFSSFGGKVTIDVTSSYTGTVFPRGTEQEPVNNLADALLIAEFRGLTTLNIIGDITFGAGDIIDDYTIIGENPDNSLITINADSSVISTRFENISIQGTLDGLSTIKESTILDLSIVSGTLERCRFNGTITLDGTGDLSAINCYSGVKGEDTPTINFNGGGSGLLMRSYNGGIELTNKSGVESVSIDLNSGQIKLTSSVTNGSISVRGVGKLTNNSVGATIVEEMLDSRNLNKSLFTNGFVFLDSTSTEAGTAFPKGTEGRPVNNLDDALIIMRNNGLHGIGMTGFFTALGTHDLNGVTFVGGSGSSNVLILAGATTDMSSFEKLIVTGAFNGLARFRDCILGTTGLGGVTEVEGRIVDCIINNSAGVIQKTLGSGTLFDNCSFIAPNDPQIIVNANGKGMSLRNCTGNILVTNKTDVQGDQLHIIGARLEIDVSCTGGTYTVEGNGVLTDNSNGTIVVSNLSAGGSSVWTTQEKNDTLAYSKKASDNAEQANLKL
jgi:hypothetical protein